VKPWSIVAVALIVLFSTLLASQRNAQRVDDLTSRVNQHRERREVMCDRYAMMFSGSVDEARRPPYTPDTRRRIQTDLSIFAPITEGCIDIPPATDYALGHLDNDQALQKGVLELDRALTAAKTKRWPL
jgi:hypothetical protein